MRQIGACKLGEPLEGGRAALQAMAKYCSDKMRTREFESACVEGRFNRLFSAFKSVQGDAQIPDEWEGEPVSPRAHRPSCQSSCHHERGSRALQSCRAPPREKGAPKL